MVVLVLGGCQYGPSRSACILAVFSPVLAPQVLRIQIEHWQTRRRQLVKILHGAGAGERARLVSKRKQVVGRSAGRRKIRVTSYHTPRARACQEAT